VLDARTSLTEVSNGLRKAGATVMIENGASQHQAMAFYGWEQPNVVVVYARRAHWPKLAQEASRHLRRAIT
jgi:hypothetical protein